MIFTIVEFAIEGSVWIVRKTVGTVYGFFYPPQQSMEQRLEKIMLELEETNAKLERVMTEMKKP